MMSRKTLILATLLSSFAAGSAIADDRSTADSPWYPTISADATPADSAFGLAYNSNTGVKETYVGDFENGYAVQETQGSLQCASCNVDNGFTTDFQIEDQKRFDQENRAYNYQAGRGSSQSTVNQQNGRNLAIIGQGPRSQDAISRIEQVNNFGDESKAMITDHTSGSVANITQDTSEAVVAKVNMEQGEANRVNINQIEASNSLVNIDLKGSTNNISGNQTGDSNVMVVDMQGNDNDIRLDQAGDENIVMVETIEGREANSSLVMIGQYGNNNQGFTRIGGDNNSVMALQQGNNDYFCSTQVSNNNSFSLTQR